jgi:DNA-binding transcriptional MerR regulator
MVILMHTISRRMARYLEKSGLIIQSMESAYLNFSDDDEDSLLQLQGASVSYHSGIVQQG